MDSPKEIVYFFKSSRCQNDAPLLSNVATNRLTVIHEFFFNLEKHECVIQKLSTTLRSGFLRKENEEASANNIRKTEKEAKAANEKLY